MHQDKSERMTAHVIEPEALDSLKAEFAGDIRSFVANTIENDESVSRMLGKEALRSHVIETLTTRAHGNFHCASVLLRQIKEQINMAGIEETIRWPSGDIDFEIVQDILHTIDLQGETRAKLARRVLAFITAAKEPMTAEAMCHALGMSYVLETHQFPSGLDKFLVPDVGVLVKCCEGLIAIDPVTRLVTMVQDDVADCVRSARSWSLTNRMCNLPSNKDHFSFEEMTMLADITVAYLSMDIFAEGPCHRLAALRKRLDEYPFLGYAARHWGHHARELKDLRFGYSATEYAASHLLTRAKSLESVLQVRDLDADVVRLLEALQKGDGHDEALDATRIRSGISTLQMLSGAGHTRMVLNLLARKPATSFEPDSFGTSAIHEAAQAGWDDIVHILIEAGADPIAMDRNGKTPRYYAARNGCDKVLTVLKDSEKMKYNYHELLLALFEAIEAGETHVVICLLEHLVRKTANETSPVLISIRSGHFNILEILLVHGEKFSCHENPCCPSLSPSDRIPLHQAIKHGRADMAKLLLDHGADIQTLDDKERNASFETLKAPNTDGLTLLLDRGIKIDCPDSEGNTVLHQAAMDGLVEHARLLIGRDIIPKNSFNNEGLQPLHLAIRAQQFEIVDMLLQCEGVSINTEATGQAAGWTPLRFAVVAGSLKLCDKLIQMGAHVNLNEGLEPPMLATLAVDCGHFAIYDLLVAAEERPRHVSKPDKNGWIGSYETGWSKTFGLPS